MVARLLNHPFTLGPGGVVTTVEQVSDEHVGQLIQVAIGTKIGERVMQPAFGVPDPAWHSLSAGDVQAALDDHGPDGITINTVTVTETAALSTVVQVEFARDEVADQ